LRHVRQFAITRMNSLCAYIFVGQSSLVRV